MTDLLLKASDIHVTHNGVKEYRDGSNFGTIEFVADGEFGYAEIDYTLNHHYTNWAGEYSHSSVDFAHFAPVIDDEEVEDGQNLETLKTAIEQYILSDLV